MFAQPLGRGDGVGALASVLAAQHAEEFDELVGEGRNSFRRGTLLRGAAALPPAFSRIGLWKLPVFPAASAVLLDDRPARRQMADGPPHATELRRGWLEL